MVLFRFLPIFYVFFVVAHARNRLLGRIHKKESTHHHLTRYHHHDPYHHPNAYLRGNYRKRDYHHTDAKQIDYDLHLEQQEFRDLYHAHNFNDYYMDAFEEAATSVWLVTRANQRVAADDNQIFSRNEDEVIQVHWPDSEAPTKFKWDDYIDRVDKGELSEEQQKSVYSSTDDAFGLRKHTEMQLLEHSMSNAGGVNLPYNEDCLVDLGSNTPKSDLDFSYIRWDDITKVVNSLIKFYNQFYKLYDSWPLETFDLNFYIATGFIKEEPDHQCWDSIAGDNYARLRNLFTQIWHNDANTKAWYELAHPGAYNNALYKKHDSMMCYLFIQRRFKYDFTEKGADTKILRLIKYSELFYHYMHRVQTTPDLTFTDGELDQIKLDRVKMFLKTLLYFMNYWSDESYVSNQALQLIIGKSVEAVPADGKYLAALDCIVFVNRYKKEAILKNPAEEWTEEKKLLWFWDRASKYIFRVAKVMQLCAEYTSEENRKKKNYAKFKDDTAVGAWPDNDALTAVNMKKFNLWRLAERWQRKWEEENDAGEYIYGGEGEKKIRGDVAFEYIFDQTKSIDIADDSFPERYHSFVKAFKEARAIWNEIKRRYPVPTSKTGIVPVNQLYFEVHKVRVYIEKFLMKQKLKHSKALEKIYKKLEQNTLKLVTASIHKDGDGRHTFAFPYKSIRLTALTDEVITNPFQDDTNSEVLENV